MKKKFFFCQCIFLFSLIQIHPLEFELGISPLFSIRNSCSEEALFFNGYFGSESSDMCSLLEWSEKRVFSYGIETDFAITKENHSFIFENGALFAFPYNAGTMTDTDWNVAGTKSTYSEFNNEIDQCFDVWSEFSLKYYFRYFSLVSSLGAKYSYRAFNATNGHGWYYLDTESPHYYPDGKYHLVGIDYSSIKIASLAGFGIEKPFSFGLTIFVGTKFSPFSFVLATDRHLKRDYETKDYVYSIFGNFHFYAGAKYKISEKFSVNLSLNAEYFRFTKCDEYYDWDETNHDTLSSQKAGYSYHEFGATLSVRWQIFECR